MAPHKIMIPRFWTFFKIYNISLWGIYYYYTNSI
jgi:hypothetical protein